MLLQVGLFVDGVVVCQVGKEIFKLVCKYVDEVIIVIIDEMCVVIKDLFDDICFINEFVGVFVVVGLKKYIECSGI